MNYGNNGNMSDYTITTTTTTDENETKTSLNDDC